MKEDYNSKFIYSNKATVIYFCTVVLLASLPSGGCFSENDDRIKYAVVRTEGIDYIELIDNLEQEYDIVFQDEYFVFMEKH